MMKSMQRSGRLLVSKATASRRGTRNFTIKKYISGGQGDAFRTREAAAAQHKSRDGAFRQSPGEFSVRKQNLVFEDKLDTSDFDLSTAEKHRPVPLDLLKRNPDLDVEYVVIGEPPHFHPVYLRDACPCPRCVDPSSTQKKFQTTDIPFTIRASSVEELENQDLKITWDNDVPGFEDHVSVYPQTFFEVNKNRWTQTKDRSNHLKAYTWNKYSIAANLKYITYDQWMTDDAFLGRALIGLQRSGLIIVRDIPETETAVEDIANRMGPIRDSFYGRTWDVKPVPEAKNVAYTQKYLGLHMDLLYMADPPGFQFLHCLKNSCEGGESIFVDSFHAAGQLNDTDFDRLINSKLAYHYRNAGEHYFHEHRIFETVGEQLPKDLGRIVPGRERPTLTHVNYSPPFQAPTHTSQFQQALYTRILRSLRKFAERVEAHGNLFEYKLKPGECVIFNNRRVLHGRRQFEAEGGERWLKGAYVDTDAFQSRLRVSIEKARSESHPEGIPHQHVFPEKHEEYMAYRLKRLQEAKEVEGESVSNGA